MGSLLMHITPSTALPLRHIIASVSCCSSGETIISPGAKQGLIPLAIPLSKNSSGSVTALLRWPTAPPGMDMPVVEVWRTGVRLIARNVDEYIHRILVEEDAQELTELYIASAEAGQKLYKKGTLGCPYEEVASIAQWEDEQIEFIRESE